MKQLNTIFILAVCILISQNTLGQQIFGTGTSLNDTEKTLTELLSESETSPEKARDTAENILKTLDDSQIRYKIVVYNIFSKSELYRGNPEESVKWAEQALKLSQSSHFVEGELLSKNSMVSVYVIQNKIEEGLELSTLALEKAEQADLEYFVMIFSNAVATFQTRKGNYDKAINYYQTALNTSRELEDITIETKMLNNLSSLLIMTKDYDKGLDILEQGIELAKKQDNKSNMAVLLLNKAFAYAELGKTKEQESTLNTTLALAREIGSVRLECAALTNLADLMLTQSNYNKAAELSKKAMAIAEKTGDSNQIIVNEVTYAQAKSHLGYHDDALEMLQKALESFKDAQMEAEVIQVTLFLSEAYEKAGKPWEALSTYKQFKEKSDALFQSEKQKIVTELYAKFESEQKEKEILLLSTDNQKKQAQRNIILVIAVSFVLIAFMVFQRLRTARKTNAQLKTLNKKLNELSLKDTLTGLYNRRYFLSHIESHIAYAKRKQEDLSEITGKLVFMIIDIDHFKRVNDNYGHHAGDDVLQEFSRRLENTFRESDVVVRWGGEEFLAVLRDSTLEGATLLAERILKVIASRPFGTEKKDLNITCSLGYVCFPFTESGTLFNWEKTIQIADTALYKAKATGRNKAIGVSASPELKEESEAETVIGNFDEAIEKKLINIIVTTVQTG